METERVLKGRKLDRDEVGFVIKPWYNFALTAVLRTWALSVMLHVTYRLVLRV